RELQRSSFVQFLAPLFLSKQHEHTSFTHFPSSPKFHGYKHPLSPLMAKGFAQDKQWNWHNFWICLSVGFVGQLAFGYPSSIIGVTLAQPAFLEYMGLLTVVDGVPRLRSNANSLIGATSGVFQVGTKRLRLRTW